MRTRRKNSSGQAMVMVTLSLMAMAGLMGLAVDLGWSFYVQKDAQAAADGVAMAAAQEAYNGLDGNFSTVSTTCTTSNTACTTTLVNTVLTCTAATAVLATGTLADGCKYAAKNGFTDGQNSQKVTVQAFAPTSNANMPPGTTGLDYRNVHYWVRVVAVQTVPQLFSAVLGNRIATVAASAVAGITGNTVPGSMILTDQPNDCFDGGGGTLCGQDLDLACTFCTVSAPTGPIYLASTCNGVSTPGCGTSEGSSSTANYAGAGGDGFFGIGAGTVTASAIDVQTPGAVYPPNHFTPTAQQLSASSIFLDPTTGENQPPILPAAAVPTCGLPNGQLGKGPAANAGPFGYYSYDPKTGHPNGNPIQINGNITFSMSANNAAGCTGLGGTYNASNATLQSGTFPTYIFYGGMTLDTVFNFNAGLGPGQYVMVGTNGSGSCGASVFCVTNAVGVLTGDNTAGTMFIFTSPQKIIDNVGTSTADRYPGLDTQLNATVGRPEIADIVALNLAEGNVNVKQVFAATTLTGVIPGANVPTALNQYSGIAFWQDRANSTVKYDSSGHVTSSTNPTPPPSGANGMSIAGFINGVTVNGVIYQPRGAYITDFGVGANVNVTVQIISGGLYLSGLGTSITLGTPTQLLTNYTASMIQ